ncbi:uncharacterized protein LOC123880700 isoform X4 [Maniola jurtina]|uniref:uncharacterized protein LOC123880700 isoform X4 n=1 Tax=Maniola jurtina TaxID=191418 RepID=UPI001E685EFE|nr:uncharacterized protein LOC123880700 isoform X4 [Maniola jurtina]
MDDQKKILNEYANNILQHYKNEEFPNIWYPLFNQGPKDERNHQGWVNENFAKFLKGTRNEILFNRWFCSELGAVTALTYSPSGSHIIVGHASGMIQMDSSLDDPPEYCIKADPALECLNTQYYGSPGISSYATPFITQRSAALALGLMADQSKMAVGYSDTSIKVYDMETVETITMYKVQKVRLQLIPKKLQRMHSGQVCALRCHDQNTNLFASGAWDKTLRIWDVRCKVGCVMTFEGVNICADSIDLNRDHCIVGSWQPTEAFTVWDLVAKKKLHTVRVQNRRPDVDGEYIYACRYWRSKEFNRKGKYGIIGGSGTNCVEIINLHNRYIACSYPAPGTVLAITSHNDKIAFGGTAPVLNIVSFHDPKHEECKVESETEYDYTVKDPTWDDKSMTEALESTSQAKSTISNITRSLDRGAISTINQQATPPPSC